MRVYDGGDLEEDVDEHRWIPTIAVVARNEADFGVLAKSELWPIRERDPRQRVWTDDYSNVVGALLRNLREKGWSPVGPTWTKPAARARISFGG